MLLALLSFTGCTLIDQKTFAPSPEAKARRRLLQRLVVLDARTPLVTIDYTVASPDYGELLHDAVRAAEGRDADVQYDVVSVMKDTSEVSPGQERATGVMRAIMRDRVPASRIHLGLRTDPTLASSQCVSTSAEALFFGELCLGRRQIVAVGVGGPKQVVYSGTTSPEPPNSAGKSFSFGKPSCMCKHRLGVIDMDLRGERKIGDGGREDVDHF